MADYRENYIAPIYNLSIKEDLGEGFHIGDNVFISNNREIKEQLLTEPLKAKIGTIETATFKNCKSFFYSSYKTMDKEKVDTTIRNHRLKLLNFLYACESFFIKLWLIKDNSCIIDIGYLEIFEILPDNKIMSFFGSTNYLGLVNTFANGEIKDSTYEKKEIELAMKIFSKFKFANYEESYNPSDLSSIYMKQNNISLAFALLSDVRPQPYLGSKIASLCTLFECLFSTNPGELVHKLSERIAFFLEHNPEKRFAMFKKVKDIYKIRSLIVHGVGINENKHNSLSEISTQADEITRRIFHKIFRNESIFEVFKNMKGDPMEDFLNMMVFGRKIK